MIKELNSKSIDMVNYDFKNHPIKTHLNFGIEFLDKATGGILESDLILLGARSGAGKSEIATMIAQYNAYKQKRVAYYALEADQNEIHHRILYREIAKLYYRQGNKDHISYRDYILGNITAKIRDIRKQALENLTWTFNNLDIVYRGCDDITAEDLANDISIKHKEVDMFIIDHVHYIDSDELNENKALKELTKRLRDTALYYKKPIICIAHLRKKDRFNKDIAPELDEFHGSSDLVKIATKVITFAPYYGANKTETHRKETIVKIAKNRLDGSTTGYLAKLVFDIRLNKYENTYNIGRIQDCRETFNPITDPDYLPYWAKTMEGVTFNDNTSDDKQRDQREKTSGLSGDQTDSLF